jgi:hypothetical protein
MSVLDAIELEVLRNALTAAAAEMDVTMWANQPLDHCARDARLLYGDLRRARQ